jgi:hypothetical protein
VIANGLGIGAADINKAIAPGLRNDTAHLCADCFQETVIGSTITCNASSGTAVLEFKVEYGNIYRSALRLRCNSVRRRGKED